jgi:predicted ribosome quality control (RQC) complex YloA/Tae2 family protein
MNQAELEQISVDAAAAFTGLRFGKVFPLGRSSIAIDLFPHSGEYLYVNCDPRQRSCYLITRRLKDLERSATHASPFVINMRKLLFGREVRSIAAIPEADKVLAVELVSPEETLNLVIQLGGRRPNILILDSSDRIIDAFHDTGSDHVGKLYEPPPRERSSEPVRETGGRALS